MSANQTTTANATERHRATESRTQESSEHRDERLRLQRERLRAAREHHVARIEHMIKRDSKTVAHYHVSLFRLAFEYSPDINYSAHSKIAIGPMDQICRYCQALKFHYDPPGMCCSLGKVVLLPLLSPPEPLQSLLADNETNKNVSSKFYYVYRLMIRNNQDNYILRYRQLYHQYVVGMYAKIESERLRFLRFNQVKLRSEDYIHLRDTIIGNNDENLNITNIGNAFILLSSYIGSPRNMQEYIQDAMTYKKLVLTLHGHQKNQLIVVKMSCLRLLPAQELKFSFLEQLIHPRKKKCWDKRAIQKSPRLHKNTSMNKNMPASFIFEEKKENLNLLDWKTEDLSVVNTPVSFQLSSHVWDKLKNCAILQFEDKLIQLTLCLEQVK
ncbi:helitron_like_N domain-containing protein [Caerostris extrusa]|uniref:Helitron_like_N domain-containing protein n=1 Tax=Caerostris extrusa TaxID=172846 RepID=A0AAV4M9Y1_CAEEX|nr:helitron_like_N domain-containing protein [Caerostris extrusa]